MVVFRIKKRRAAMIKAALVAFAFTAGFSGASGSLIPNAAAGDGPAPGSAEAQIDANLKASQPQTERNLTNKNRPCKNASYSLNHSQGQFRYLIKIGDAQTPKDRWEVKIKSGLEEKERFTLTLTNKNTVPGQWVLTPMLNTAMDSFCLDKEGSPPPLWVKLIISAGTYGTGQLSVVGESPESKPNWFDATTILDDCLSTNECSKKYAAKDPEPEPDGTPKKYVELWSGDNSLTYKQKRERLKNAFSAVVWIGLHQSEEETQEETQSAPKTYKRCQQGSCMAHCSGFFVAKRVIMTNAHCLIGHQKGETDYKYRYALHAWLRPVNGGGQELWRAPDFQALTPLFVGRPSSKIDYALLWVEHTDLSRRNNEPLPAALKIVEYNNEEKTPLLTMGYPGAQKLVLNFDEHCKHIGGQDYFLHQCDTSFGASGSPVFDRDLEAVRALHFAGISKSYEQACGKKDNFKNEKKCFNYAAKISAIRDDIAEKMTAADLWRFVGDGCAEQPSDARGVPLSTEGVEMPVLEGGLGGASPKMIVDAYNSLPAALKSPARHKCGTG